MYFPDAPLPVISIRGHSLCSYQLLDVRFLRMLFLLLVRDISSPWGSHLQLLVSDDSMLHLQKFPESVNIAP